MRYRTSITVSIVYYRLVSNKQARELYQRLLKNGKTKMAAIGAVMRKIVHVCFGVLKINRLCFSQKHFSDFT
jgi:hypothetical protein